MRHTVEEYRKKKLCLAPRTPAGWPALLDSGLAWCVNWGVVSMFYENPDGVSVHDGFPNPATDAALQGLDLNKVLIKNGVSTYFMRIAGDGWRSIGIFDGDMAVIDRALAPRRNDLVIWCEGSDFMISPRHALPIGKQMWGVVTAAIHLYREAS